MLQSREDYDLAFQRYLRLMRQGGEQYYDRLLEKAHIPSPFKEGALDTLAERVEALLRQVKPTK